MDLATLNISEYERFERYIMNLREPDFPYDKFVTMVIRLPRSIAIDHLCRATYHESMLVLAEAVDLLSRLSPIHACPRCLELLDHPDPSIRQVAVESLHLMRIRCEDRVAKHLETETHGDVRYNCAELLGDIGTLRSLSFLQRMIAEDTSTDYEGRPTRTKAVEAVEKITSRATW